MDHKISRRKLLQMAAAGTSGLVLAPLAGCGESSAPAASMAEDAGSATPQSLDFASLGEGEGWGDGWVSVGVANLRREAGLGVLEAGSDIFPNDPRPVAFARDQRFVDGSIRAQIHRAGSSVGVVLRRSSIRNYYAAILNTDLLTLSIVRRSGFDLVTLASTLVPPTALPNNVFGPATLELAVSGQQPSQLQARLSGADGLLYEAAASDDSAELQVAGDAGVLAQSDTLLPDTAPVVPALGNLHLLPYTVQEGQVFLNSPAGQAFINLIRQRSTAAFSRIEILTVETPQPSAAALIVATTGAPIAGGAVLHVASDLPAEVEIEIARTPDFTDARVIAAGATDPVYAATITAVDGLSAGDAWWRPRLRRSGHETIGPARRFRVLPSAGDPATFSLIYGSCGSQFGPIFDRIAERHPDLFIWQGDLNYIDAHGPFAQSFSGYAGAWRHFLDNPRLAAILENTCFVAGRDDHDYGLQDANSTNLVPWGLAPWEALINPQTYQRLSIGLADIWMLDQRRYKSDPTLPDTPEKTLLGLEQRQWLFDCLADSRAPFQIICSPTTVAPAPGANARDGSWAIGFNAERQLLLDHLAQNVSGRTVFLTGDTHFTMLWDRDGLFEQRACPLDIPAPNDQNISNPTLELNFGSTPGVLYWSRRSHFSQLTVGAEAGRPVLTVELVRDDGVVVNSTRFEG